MTRDTSAAKPGDGPAAQCENAEETETHVLLNGVLVKASDILSMSEAAETFGVSEQTITANWYLLHGGFVTRPLSTITVGDALDMLSGACQEIECSQEDAEIDEAGEAAHEEEHRNGGRDRAHAPPALLRQRVEVDGEAVEGQTRRRHQGDEAGDDDGPTGEPVGRLRRAHR